MVCHILFNSVSNCLIMVQIGVSEDGQSVVIKIKIWHLAQIIDSDNWVQCIISECQKVVIQHLGVMKDPSE